MNYKIIFDGCHGHAEGAVVDAAMLGGDIDYLLRVGAVVEAKPEPKAKAEKPEAKEEAKPEPKADAKAETTKDEPKAKGK